MADGRGRFELVESRSACGWPSRPCLCRLLLGCSAAALALAAAAATACAFGSAREQGPGLRGLPAALFGLGGTQLQPDAHCDAILGQEGYDRLMRRSGAFERFASGRRLQTVGQAGNYAAADGRLRATNGAGASAGGILDFTLGGKHPGATGVLSWQGARSVAQEIGAVAQFRDAFGAAAARAQQTRSLAREEDDAVSADTARMFDQCLQLSSNNVIAGAERSMDGEVLDLTFKYVLGSGRDAPEMRPNLQHVYWLPRQQAVCKAPFADGGVLPNASAPTTMEPGRIYAFHCHRLGEYTGTVDVSVVTDVGLFQAVMPPIAGRPGATHGSAPPSGEAAGRRPAAPAAEAPSAADAAAARRRHDAARAGTANERALAHLLDAGACSICKSCGGAWPYTLLVQEQADEVNDGLPGAACGPQASWRGSWAFCCLGEPPAAGGRNSSSA